MKNRFKQSLKRRSSGITPPPWTQADASGNAQFTPRNAAEGARPVAVDGKGEIDWKQLFLDNCDDKGELGHVGFAQVWRAALETRGVSPTDMPSDKQLFETFATIFGHAAFAPLERFLLVIEGLWQAHQLDFANLVARLRKGDSELIDLLLPPSAEPMPKLIAQTVREELDATIPYVDADDDNSSDWLTELYLDAAQQANGSQIKDTHGDVRKAFEAVLSCRPDGPLETSAMLKSLNIVWQRSRHIADLEWLLSNVSSHEFDKANSHFVPAVVVSSTGDDVADKRKKKGEMMEQTENNEGGRVSLVGADLADKESTSTHAATEGVPVENSAGNWSKARALHTGLWTKRATLLVHLAKGDVELLDTLMPPSAEPLPKLLAKTLREDIEATIPYVDADAHNASEWLTELYTEAASESKGPQGKVATENVRQTFETLLSSSEGRLESSTVLTYLNIVWQRPGQLAELRSLVSSAASRKLDEANSHDVPAAVVSSAGADAADKESAPLARAAAQGAAVEDPVDHWSKARAFRAGLWTKRSTLLVNLAKGDSELLDTLMPPSAEPLPKPIAQALREDIEATIPYVDADAHNAAEWLTELFTETATQLQGPQVEVATEDVQKAFESLLSCREGGLESSAMLTYLNVVWQRSGQLAELESLLSKAGAHELDRSTSHAVPAAAGTHGALPNNLPDVLPDVEDTLSVDSLPPTPGPHNPWPGTAIWADDLDDETPPETIGDCSEIERPISLGFTDEERLAFQRAEARKEARKEENEDDECETFAAVETLRTRCGAAEGRRFLRLLEGPTAGRASLWRPPTDAELDALLPYRKLLCIEDLPHLHWLAKELRTAQLPFNVVPLLPPTDRFGDPFAAEAFRRFPPPPPPILFARPAQGPRSTPKSRSSSIGLATTVFLQGFEVEARHPLQEPYDQAVALAMLLQHSSEPRALVDAAEESWVAQHGEDLAAWRSDVEEGIVINTNTGDEVLAGSADDPRERLSLELRIGCELMGKLREWVTAPAGLA